MRRARFFIVLLACQTLWLATASAQAPAGAYLILPKTADYSSPVDARSLPYEPEPVTAEHLDLVNSHIRSPELETVSPESATNRPGVHWGSLLKQDLFWLTFQHIDRLIMEPQTRAELNGPYFKDWSYIVHHVQWNRWSDGDKFFTSNIGHPAQGAVVGYIFRQNDGSSIGVEQDFHDPAYRKGLLKAFAFITVDAFNWKLGPVSEATIGHVGLHLDPKTGTNRTGLNDYVTNEVGGVVLMIGEDWLDKHVAAPFERHTRNRCLINTVRIFTMPSQSWADLMAWKKPWYRYGRN